MAQLNHVLAYLLSRCPNQDQLSSLRITKLAYLADWKLAIDEGRRLTDIDWRIEENGPFSHRIKNELISNSSTFVESGETDVHGRPRRVFSIQGTVRNGYGLDEGETAALDHVIEAAGTMKWIELVQLVYSTYGVSTSGENTSIDILLKAKEYNLSRASR